MQELFEKINELQEEKVCEVTLSYLEIYNETIRDLLVEGGSKTTLMLREDANQTVSVAGLSSHRPQNVCQPKSAPEEYSHVAGTRGHGHHRARQRVADHVPDRSQRNLVAITRRPPDQRLLEGPKRLRQRASYHGNPQHHRLGG